MRPVSVGILSIGDMGLGVARLLKAHDYRVLTVGLGRRYDPPISIVYAGYYSVYFAGSDDMLVKIRSRGSGQPRSSLYHPIKNW